MTALGRRGVDNGRDCNSDNNKLWEAGIQSIKASVTTILHTAKTDTEWIQNSRYLVSVLLTDYLRKCGTRKRWHNREREKRREKGVRKEGRKEEWDKQRKGFYYPRSMRRGLKGRRKKKIQT